MKRVMKYFMTGILCFVMCLSLTACGEAQIKAFYLKPMTLAQKVLKGDEFDASQIRMIVEYSNGKSEEVSFDDIVIDNTIDTNTVGRQVLQVSYKDEVANIYIDVCASEADVNMVTSFSSDLLTEYKANSGEQLNKEEEFVDLDNPLVVGTENPLDFRINAKGISPEGELVENLEKVRTEIKLEKGEQTGEEWQFTQLSDEEVDEIASLDTENTQMQFKEVAIGNTYRITVKAVNFNTEYGNNDSFTGVFRVVEGYNVYSASDLALIDNNGNDWKTFKQIHNLQEDLFPKALILQSSVNITAGDVPENKFWSESQVSGLGNLAEKTNQPIVGSLRDGNAGIYIRKLKDGERFNLYGNYFNINCTEFPRAVFDRNVDAGKEEGKGINVPTAENPDLVDYIVMHCPLFKFVRVKPTNSEDHRGEVKFEDIYFTGNGGRSSDPLNSGSIILLKAREVSFTAQNTIHRDFFIGYFGGYDQDNRCSDKAKEKEIHNEGNTEFNSKIRVINSKGYNDYNCLFYFYGCPDVCIEGGEYIGAGGPAIIANFINDENAEGAGKPNEYNKNTGEGGITNNIVIVKTRLESFVTGQEPWFNSYGATALVSNLTATNEIFKAFGKSFLTDKGKSGEPKQMMNVKFLLTCGGDQAMSSGRVITRGSALIFDTKADYEAYVSEENPGKLADGSLYYGYDRNKAYINGSYMYTNPTAQGNDFGATRGEFARFEASSSGLNIIPTGKQANPALFYSHSDISKALKMFAPHDASATEKEQVSRNQEQVYQDLMSSKYLNIYLSNGFGGIIDLFNYTAPAS